MPKRTESQKLGDIGEFKAALVFKSWGWTADIINSDYGEDLDCNVFVEGERTGLHFRCQVKSTVLARGLVRRLKNGDYSVSIETDTIKTWLQSYYPVFLVVYDEELDTLFWLNASQKLSIVLDRLSQKTTSLHVKKQCVLDSAESEIRVAVAQFYADMLRLSAAHVMCEVIPIIMPCYRALGLWHQMDLKLEATRGEGDIEFERTRLQYDFLPSWATTIRCLEPHFGLAGWKITQETQDLQYFLDSLKQALPTIISSEEKVGWLSFSCSPVLLEGDIKSPNEAYKFWKHELIGWRNYAYIDNQIVSESEYAFAPPKSYLKPIGKAAGQGWGIYPFVSIDDDLAIRFWSNMGVTPAFREETEARRKTYLAQFLPWIVPKTKRTELAQLLEKYELRFMHIEELSADDSFVGIICSFWFDPNMQFYSAPKYWSELEGGVRERLRDVFTLLPGQEGPSSVEKFLLDIVSDKISTEGINHLTIEYDGYIHGLPLELDQRLVEVNRYQEINKQTFDTNIAQQKLNAFCKHIETATQGYSNVSAEASIFESYGQFIGQLTLIWTPLLSDSSASSFERISEQIVGAFDKILPRQPISGSGFLSTYNIFKYLGAVIFEGNEDYFE